MQRFYLEPVAFTWCQHENAHNAHARLRPAHGRHSPGSECRTSRTAAQRKWIDSYNHRDEKSLSAIEADEFCVTFADGQVQKKPDQLGRLRKPVPNGAEFEIVIEISEVHVYGKAAVITGIVAERGKLPNEQGGVQSFSQRSRYTDTWILQNGRWRVVASHLSELK